MSKRVRFAASSNVYEPEPDDPILSPARDARRYEIRDQIRGELSGATRPRASPPPNVHSASLKRVSGAGDGNDKEALFVGDDGSDSEWSLSSDNGNDSDNNDELEPFDGHKFRLKALVRLRGREASDTAGYDKSPHVPSNTITSSSAVPDPVHSSLVPPSQSRELKRSSRQSEFLDAYNANRSHHHGLMTALAPNLSLSASRLSISAGDTPTSPRGKKSGRRSPILSLTSDNESAPVPMSSVATPSIFNSYLRVNLLCSDLLLQLSHIRGFSFYFSLLSLPEEGGVPSDDPIAQFRGLFSLGIPLCYLFDLLPAEEGFPKINMSQFNTEEFSVNPTREKNRAITLFIMHLSSEEVKRTIPGCVPFLITDISGPPDDLIKVINAVNAIIEYLPSTVFRSPDHTSTPNLSLPEPGALYGLMRPSNPIEDRTQCQTADAAFNHAKMAEHLISDALARSDLYGLYYIQVGFNEELIARGQGTLEEIYIYADSEFPGDHAAVIPPALARLSQILSPFPAVLYTPENTYQISPYVYRGELSESDLWHILKMTGVFSEGLGFPKTTIRGGSQTAPTGNGAPAPHPRRQSNSTSGKGKGRDVPDEDPDKDDFEDDPAYSGGGGGGGTPAGAGGSRGDQGPKNLFIPFLSKLVIKDNKREVLSGFTTSANVNMKLAESTFDGRTKAPATDFNPCPDGWFGPWFSIQLHSIQTNSSNVVSDNVHYNMSMAQVRVVASSCLSSFLSFSPGGSHGMEDPVKVKSERNYTGGGWATFSGAPSVKVGGTASQTSGTETSQKKWEITVSPSSDKKTEKSITWKYALNDKYYSPQSTATFQPGPSVGFGYKLHARRPRIEVELVVHWSASPNNTRPRLRHWFSGHRSKENPQPPSAFTNFLHQISVSVDLEDLNENAWVVGLNPDLPDEESLPDFHGLRQFQPTQVKADSVSNKLNCEITLHRALHGRIQLDKQDRTNDRPLLPSLSGSSNGAALPPLPPPPLLPTPPRTPVSAHML